MTVTSEEFRKALGSLAAGVSVVTLQTPDGPAGITVTSFTSLSLLPPLVLVCIDRRARLHDHFQRDTPFAVNMLADDQESVSRKFAARGEDPFADFEHDLSPLGAPLLRGTVAGVECVVVDLLSGGDHTIVVGEVRQTVVNEHEPLLHFRGKYGRLARS